MRTSDTIAKAADVVASNGLLNHNAMECAMSDKLLPTPEELHKILRCDIQLGKLYWCERTPDMFTDGHRTAEGNCNNWNARLAGRQALSYMHRGYLRGHLFGGRIFYAHRVIWAMGYDEWPEDQIDHINHDRSDNRLENLRSVTRAENRKNISMVKHNTSGCMGVHWSKSSKKWIAKIVVNKEEKYLGSFDDKRDAINARKAAESQYGFHPNHGT